ncbi:MAG: hypothetical protein K6U74_06575 [Firmicutes bacterium]|nr:hypothetical protein [Bacillota bacterium]
MALPKGVMERSKPVFKVEPGGNTNPGACALHRVTAGGTAGKTPAFNTSARLTCPRLAVKMEKESKTK